ncbi:squalene synthase HpnC [Wenxinia saemankumensis]|uniref:Squalene synthase HpnC n=2 Tax=Wenxinia saemankumensis TaxID=1447782 RepID=A0A1M6D0Z2_9RHOB|nr:squalene synthase HpnC [Wenxinia saemankumensis]
MAEAIKNLAMPPEDAGRPGAPRPRGPEAENFPVASRLVAARLRPAVMAFYRVVRAADDIADSPDLPAAAKARQIAALDAALAGAGTHPLAADLARELAAIGRPAALRHARTMMRAFAADAAGTLCRDEADLIASCRLSADPVGRFLLDLHGEDAEAAGQAADALSTALQILNHLQDLGEDHRDLGRLYLPLDWIAEAGAARADLGAPRLSPGLRRAVDRALDLAEARLARAAVLPSLLRSRRLAAEARAIHLLARALARRLRRQDPLAGRVAPGRGDRARAALAGLTALAAPRRRP